MMNFSPITLEAGTDFFGRITTALQSVYKGVSGIITLVAAVAIAICTVGMMAGKNQKTVEEFKAWRTRVMITWIVFAMLGILVQFGSELTGGMGFDMNKDYTVSAS